MKCWQENSEDSKNQHDKYETGMKGHDTANGVRYGMVPVSYHRYVLYGTKPAVHCVPTVFYSGIQ